MAATNPNLFFLKSNLKRNVLFHSPNPFKSFSRAMKPLKISSSKLSGFSLKCVCANNGGYYTVSNKELSAEKIQESPLEKLAKVIINALKVLQKPAMAALVVGLLLMYDPNSALAASGGRMGGQLFSSRSTSTSSGSGYSSSSSYGGSDYSSSSTSGGRGDSSSSLSGGRDYSSSSPSGGRGYSSSSPSGGSSYSSSTSTSSASGFSSSRGMPASSYRLFSSSTSDDSSYSYSAPNNAPSPSKSGDSGGDAVTALFVVLCVSFFFDCFASLANRAPPKGKVTKKTSVLKLQVALLGMGRSIQRDLDKIAETADTSTAKGLVNMLTETTLALLRHPDYCISAYSCVDIKGKLEEGEEIFNRLSVEERGKFDEETLVNVNNIKKTSSTIPRSSEFNNEYIVVTILVAAEGGYYVPTINSFSDLKVALQMLSSISARDILAVEVLWTPQNENDSLLERELHDNYPLLQPLRAIKSILPSGFQCGLRKNLFSDPQIQSLCNIGRQVLIRLTHVKLD